MYHLNMDHVRYGGDLKSFPHKPNGIQLFRLPWVRFETGFKSQQFLETTALPVTSTNEKTRSPPLWVTCEIIAISSGGTKLCNVLLQCHQSCTYSPSATGMDKLAADGFDAGCFSCLGADLPGATSRNVHSPRYHNLLVALAGQTKPLHWGP